MVSWMHRARRMKLYDEKGIEIVNQELHLEEYANIIQTLRMLELVK